MKRKNLIAMKIKMTPAQQRAELDFRGRKESRELEKTMPHHHNFSKLIGNKWHCKSSDCNATKPYHSRGNM